MIRMIHLTCAPMELNKKLRSGVAAAEKLMTALQDIPPKAGCDSYLDEWKPALPLLPVRRQIVHRTVLKGRERVASRRDFVDWNGAGSFDVRTKPTYIIA